MRTPKAATAAILAGAVALASAAYGIGTQAGDGTASAARDGDSAARDGDSAARDGGDRVVFFRFDGLADELGVDAGELRQALTDFHEQEAGERRDAFATALAEALDKPVEDVRAALEAVRPGDGARPGDRMGPGCAPHVSLRRLAAVLDVTRADLRSALREARAGEASAWEDHHEALVAFLADRFGLSEQEVEEALPEPPAFDRRGPGGPPSFGPHGPRG
jgi:hypothetical protein